MSLLNLLRKIIRAESILEDDKASHVHSADKLRPREIKELTEGDTAASW